jgi:hypothetical protein
VSEECGDGEGVVSGGPNVMNIHYIDDDFITEGLKTETRVREKMSHYNYDGQ